MAIENTNNQRIDLREILRSKQEAEAAQSQSIHIKSATEEVTISTDDIIIDEEYQRSFTEVWAKEIAKNFDPEKFGKPEVARHPSGKYAVIDGQHRIGALRFRWPGKNVTFVADLLKNANDVTSQAKRYVSRNTGKSLDTSAVLKGLLAAEDPSALEYKKIVEGCGYRMKQGGGRALPGQLHAYVFKAIQRAGPAGWQDRLYKALTTASSAWGLTQFGMDTPVVVGIGTFIARYEREPMYDQRHLERVLQRTTPAAIVAEARSISSLSRMSVEKGVIEIVRRQYNRRKAVANQVPEF